MTEPGTCRLGALPTVAWCRGTVTHRGGGTSDHPLGRWGLVDFGVALSGFELGGAVFAWCGTGTQHGTCRKQALPVVTNRRHIGSHQGKGGGFPPFPNGVCEDSGLVLRGLGLKGVYWRRATPQEPLRYHRPMV